MYRLSRRAWGTTSQETWAVVKTPTATVLSSPHGQRIVLSKSDEPRRILEEVQALAPDALAVCSAHTTSVSASDEMRDWLPLYLYPTEPTEPARGEDNWTDVDAYLDQLSDMEMDADDDLMLHVNRQPWAVVQGPERRLVVPADGLLTIWATWSFVEQGSMTSGLDGAWIGDLTASVGASHDQLDEDGSRWTVFASADPVRAVLDWLCNGWMISQYRDTWGITRGEDPLLCGFIDLLASGAQTSEFFGADYASGDGIGLSETANWQLECSLHTQHRAALLEALKPRSTGVR